MGKVNAATIEALHKVEAEEAEPKAQAAGRTTTLRR